MTATEIQAALTEAGCASCYTNASTADLLKVGLLNQISTSAAAAASGVVCADYGGGTPTYLPSTPCGVAIDTSTQQIWWYYLGAWH